MVVRRGALVHVWTVIFPTLHSTAPRWGYESRKRIGESTKQGLAIRFCRFVTVIMLQVDKIRGRVGLLRLGNAILASLLAGSFVTKWATVR